MSSSSLSRILLAASRATHAAASLPALVRDFAVLGGETWPNSAISITIRTSAYPDGIAEHQGEPAPHPPFQASRRVAVRNATYGTLVLSLNERPADPAGTLLVLDSLAQQLALAAQRDELVHRLHGQQRRLSGLQEELETAKALSRAAGIVAETKHLSFAAAQNWLRAEAQNTRRSLGYLAQLVILQRRLAHTLLSRRTA
jgi:hypothetical protein